MFAIGAGCRRLTSIWQGVKNILTRVSIARLQYRGLNAPAVSEKNAGSGQTMLIWGYIAGIATARRVEQV